MTIRYTPEVHVEAPLLFSVGFEQSRFDPIKPEGSEVRHYACNQTAEHALRNVLRNEGPLPTAFVFNLSEQGSGCIKRLLQMIRRNLELRMKPVICIADDPDCEDHARLLELGVDELLDAKVNKETLMLKIHFLSRYKAKLAQKPQARRPVKPMTLSFRRRVLDVAIATTGLLLCSPLLALCAIAIYIESGGPVIYASERIGLQYRKFKFYKFRSMYVGADTRLDEQAAQNQYADQGRNRIFLKFRKDPRVTTVGRIMRKYSLDELPQLWNVLRGDMSLIGNRPLPLYEAVQLTTDEWSARYLAPAGITGLWQVRKRGRSEMCMEERINLDIEYALKRSPWTELRILLATPFSFVQKEDV